MLWNVIFSGVGAKCRGIAWRTLDLGGRVQPRGLDCVLGHGPWGIHQPLPHSTTTDHPKEVSLDEHKKNNFVPTSTGFCFSIKNHHIKSHSQTTWLTHFRPPTWASPSLMASTGSTAPTCPMASYPTKVRRMRRLRGCSPSTRTLVLSALVSTAQTHINSTKDDLA